MKSSSAINFFTAGIFLSALVLSPFALDLALTARVIVLSVFLGICAFLLSRSQAQSLSLNLPGIFFLLFLAFNYLSIFWAVNKAEALLECERQTLAFTVFVFGMFFFRNDAEKFTNLLLKFSVIMVFAGLIPAGLQLWNSHVADKISMYNVTGLNSHKNLYSSFLFINLFFLLIALRKFTGGWKVATVITLAISFAMIILLRTKAVWIAITACVLGYFILAAYKRFIKKNYLSFYLSLSICIVIANIFFLFLFPPFIKKIIARNAVTNAWNKAQKGAELDNERAILWDKSYGMFRKHPAIGVGAGNWQIFFPDQTLRGLWRAEDLNFTFQRPHNDFLWILDETGLIGLNLFLLFIFSVLLITFRIFIKTNFNRDHALAFLIITGYLIISMFDFPKERIEHLVWINLIMAFAVSNGETEIKKSWNLNLNSFAKVVMVLMFFAVLTGIFRQKGEYFTRKMYDYKSRNERMQIIDAGKKARSFAYNIDPTSVPICWYTGNAYASCGNFSRALEDLEKAAKQNPYNRNVLNDLASALVMKGDTTMAKKYYTESARISPRFDDAKLNLVAIYISERNYDRADSLLDSLFHDSDRRTSYQNIVDAMKGTIAK
jgi:O-antigen ligase